MGEQPTPSRVIPILHAIAAVALTLWLAVVVMWPWLSDGRLSAPLVANVEGLCGKYFCHRLEYRSLAWNGAPLLVCSRCTGVIAGYLLGSVLALCGAEKSSLWRVPWAVVLIGLMGFSWFFGWMGFVPASWHAERVFAGMLGGLGGYILIARCIVLLINWVHRRQLRNLEGATA